MKKLVLSVFVLAMVSSMGAEAQEERNKIGGLDVTSTNTITGDVVATDGSTVVVGDTQISNVQAGKVKVVIDNDVGAITATDKSQVSLGNVQLENVDTHGAEIDITANNKAGKITAVDNKSSVSMGSTSLKNIDSPGKLKVVTENEVIGDVTAKGGSHVKIGTTNVQ